MIIAFILFKKNVVTILSSRQFQISFVHRFFFGVNLKIKTEMANMYKIYFFTTHTSYKSFTKQ